MEKTIDLSKYEPIHDRVLIKPTPPESTISEFIITDKEQEKKVEGLVIAVGDGIPLHNVKLDISGQATPEVLDRVESLIKLLREGRPMKIQPGDYVLYGQYAGTKVKIAGQEYIMVRELDVFCRIKKD